MKIFFVSSARMTGAFEEGDGKMFGSPAKTVENNFFLYFLWLMTGAFEEEGDYFCISCEDGEDGIFFVSSTHDPGVF